MAMNILRRWLIAVGVGGALAATAVMAIPPAGQAVAPRVGPPAPQITRGPWVNHEPPSIQQLPGRGGAPGFLALGLYNRQKLIPQVRDLAPKYRPGGPT